MRKILPNEIFTEEELLKLLNIEQEQLDFIRRKKGFPVSKITSRHRLYIGFSVMQWLKKQETESTEPESNNFEDESFSNQG